ncbi:MAG: hypothetical protein DMD72_10125 [Gemmatimonadetes bacterium]|nr:MAG: hypothetical protein DMD72_10125 [Gemmatimonadota bacterium]
MAWRGASARPGNDAGVSSVDSPPEKAAYNETARIEAFSDGVFAIAITLLILAIQVPKTDSGPLRESLLALWPSYLAFLASFMTIGVMWLNPCCCSSASPGCRFQPRFWRITSTVRMPTSKRPLSSMPDRSSRFRSYSTSCGVTLSVAGWSTMPCTPKP